jgi:hypothetical protein
MTKINNYNLQIRLEHYRNYLETYQNPPDISNIVILDVYNYIKNNNIDLLIIENPLKYIKDALISKKYIKYIEYTKYIFWKLTGICTYPTILPIEELVEMYSKIYEIHCNNTSNTQDITIPSKIFITYKILEYINKPEYLQYFPMVKSEIKKKYHDEWWNNIILPGLSSITRH